LSADEWDEDRKERIVAAAVRSLSRLHDMEVAVTRAQSPKDFQGRMHLYKGSLYGLSPLADPRSQFEHKSDVPGLYMAGQTTFPGYGVGPAAMSGILAAEALLKTELIA
jgi:phytoene dehydrogenase-like protein